MARTREFNADIALNKAIELFWEKGYANTSMREMVKHTGVAHAGLYTAFGNKEDLFYSALATYEQRIFENLFGGLESERASLKDINKLFSFITTAKDDKYFQHGCFIANTALDFTATSGPIHDLITRTFQRQVAAFAHALGNAVENKQISAAIDIADTASLFTALFYGASSLTRMKAPSEIIQQSIFAALKSIEG